MKVSLKFRGEFKMKVLIADDHALFRDGLSLQLEKINPECIILQASNFNQALKFIENDNQIKMVVMDLDMPDINWQEALKELKNEVDGFGKALKIKLVGQVDQSVIENLTSCGLMENVELITQVPHDEVKRLQEASQVLLLLVNNTPNAKGILTGKLYEYLASRRPILAIGPENGDAARLIQETHAGVTVGFEDKDKMKKVIKDFYQKYLNHNLPNNMSSSIEKYSRKAFAKAYVSLLDKTKNE